MSAEQLVSLFAVLPRSVRSEILRIVVEDLGLSKSEAARMMGVTPAAVTKFVRGDAAPSPESLARLYSSLEPDEQAAILRVLVEYVSSLVKSLAPVMALVSSLAGREARRELEAAVDELVDTVAMLMEAAEGYGGAHSSSASRLGERFSSPPSAADNFSNRRSRL